MTPVDTDPRLGTVLAGYRIEALLGRGGMGVVYLAEGLRLHRKVALKLITPRLAADDAFRERFLAESELAASLDHPNVIPVYEAGEARDALFLAMRYVEGKDLGTILDEGPLPPGRTISICRQIADALDAAHAAGLVHRDVKPSNVLVDQKADDHVYLADFGLTRRLGDEGIAVGSQSSLGTPDYVAPEQIEGHDPGGTADVYSLACLFFECLAGEPPYGRGPGYAVLFRHLDEEPPSLHTARPELPDEIDTVVATALAKDPVQRYPTCRTFVDEAQTALGLGQPPRRRRAWLLVAACLAVAITAAAIAIPLALSGGETQSTPQPPDTRPTLAITTGTLQRIDPARNELVASVPMGGQLSAIAIGDGSVFVTDHENGTVSRLDPATNTVVATGSAGGDAVDVAVGLGSLWVVNLYQGAVAMLDPMSLRIKTTVGVPGGDNRAGPIAVGDTLVWVGGEVDDGADGLWSLNDYAIPTSKLRFNELGFSMATDGGTIWLPSGVFPAPIELFRLDERTAEIEKFATMDFRVAGDIAIGDGSAWITDVEGAAVARVDLATGRILASIPVGARPNGVAWGAGAVWVANHDDGTVSKIDPATNEVISTIEVGPAPTHVVAGEDGVWVTTHP